MEYFPEITYHQLCNDLININGFLTVHYWTNRFITNATRSLSIKQFWYYLWIITALICKIVISCIILWSMYNIQKSRASSVNFFFHKTSFSLAQRHFVTNNIFYQQFFLQATFPQPKIYDLLKTFKWFFIIREFFYNKK